MIHSRSKSSLTSWGSINLTVIVAYYVEDDTGKGCEDELDCLRLANLNSQVYCDNAPSQCQHCCSKDLCNTGIRPRVVAGDSRTLHLFCVAGCCLIVKLLTVMFS
ncbi:hypothetical protein ElyMa_003431800 [Elysia marginata]|uniref:UPAR/Ly6 domain-containing protein n=1 Tax=Elysia marginata TaxID=1093978 RepID=A0AAV4JSS5_9GAST|nr:hypothetical protein ElyMa_003431800 [Elysia marginata]